MYAILMGPEPREVADFHEQPTSDPY